MSNASATPPRSPKPCSNASSPPAATRATSSSTPSAAAAPPSPRPNASTAAGSASTSPTIAITLIRHRLRDSFGEELRPYSVLGDPKDLPSAAALAQQDRYQFEWWALGLVDARPAHDKRKGADSGVDGYINFLDDGSGKAKRVVVQVKSGHVQRNQIATLKGDMEREKAEIGLFITLEPPTAPMRSEAAAAGFYEPSHFLDHRFPRVQILTIEELLSGAQAQYPRFAPEDTFRRAPRRQRQQREQKRMI